MIPYTALPHLNAILNGTSAVFLICGYILIRRKQVLWHRAAMFGALGASGLFLVSYVIYHFEVGSVRFQGTGWIRTLYFTILISHTILAVSLVPLVIVTLRRALRGEYDRHRKLARWTFPVWAYVSVTGVLVYLMLYQM